MKQMKNTVLGLLVMAAAGQAMAADSVDLKVTGTITPAACTPTLSNNGTVDYGNIQASYLSATAYTNLAEKDLQFSITCAAPTKVAFQVINGRPGSAAGVTEKGVNTTGTAPVGVTLLGRTRPVVAGLGMSDTSMVGGYTIKLSSTDLKVDGKSTGYTIGDVATGPWDAGYTSDDNFLFNANGAQYYYSFADAGTTTPLSFTTMTGTMQVAAYLNMTSQLDMTKDIKLDGLTTIKLTYI